MNKKSGKMLWVGAFIGVSFQLLYSYIPPNNTNILLPLGVYLALFAVLVIIENVVDREKKNETK